jgi:hypothetical protein
MKNIIGMLPIERGSNPRPPEYDAGVPTTAP